MKRVFSLLLAVASIGAASAQCTTDFDFGTSLWGASPDASVGEQFDTAYVNVPYNDVFHVLVPIDASAIEPTFQLPLDSIVLVNTTLIADSGAGATMNFSEVGLEIQCNNGGVSPNPCAFHGGAQYCADLTGTPTMAGYFAMSLEVEAWVTVFGVAVPQPYVFDGYILTIVGPNDIGESSDLDFTLFPNPANERVQINLPAAGSVTSAAIRDLTGRVMHSTQLFSNGQLVVDVATWAEGIYFVTLEGETQQWTERLVVRH